ncbi:MAG: outer membrane receptor for Fe3+-dicitrate [Saprospiraceae bacterium]
MKEVPFELQQVYVTSDVNAISQIASIDLELNPVSSSQEVLTRVPGLFISQHAGGGKAEQIFLRGFDVDHGTDIAITVDGLPVNMVSHAHGQGYADLHFLIPETIENIDFGKGPYYADHGNLNTAGYIDFKTKDKLENSILGIEVGDFSTIRTFGLVNLIEGEVDQNAYIATEFLSSDGPFESPQDFVRMNLMGKYVKETEKGDRFSLLVTRFSSRWNASGQIPQRLLDSGTITRYGSVDDTEGGTTSRTIFALDHSKILSENKFIKTRVYYSSYDFDLFSNFTFFLNDPINGDQIRQSEERTIMGYNSTLFGETEWNNNQLKYESGIGIRYDDVDNVSLSHTLNRETVLERFSYGNVDEINISAFANLQYKSGNWIVNPGVRMDYFNFHYNDLLSMNRINASEAKYNLS